MADDARRRWAAMAGCDRIVSGIGAVPPRRRLAQLLEGGFDLDAAPDIYGDGPVRRLEERVAELLGKQEVAFFPSGTMAQQVALRIWAARKGNSVVALHPLQHPVVWERDALSVLSGLRTVWVTREPRQPTADEVLAVDEPFGTLMVELPLREAGYLLPTFAELTELAGAARARGAYVHFDGARLWESTAYLGEELPTVAALADSVYVSFYKTLMGLSGAALAGPAEFISEAKAWRHRYGGKLFQQWPSVFTALHGLDTILPRLSSYVAHARTLAKALPGRVHPDPPHTHQFQLWLPGPASTLNEACLRLAERERVWFASGWRDQPPTGLAMTEITIAAPALSLTPADVTAIADAFLAEFNSVD
ncbi:threonine aldolase family protein [Allorhizocola rhizosphaerae]|uniref:threonine aldolase family protein n=1 Tax=Allorhizocola rhizosphaerae TaxID=1872709 RepID=UPI000E3C3675|nr:beta-eliminating lyase-related protein [Allorhizocola rhizosphaerae]